MKHVAYLVVLEIPDTTDPPEVEERHLAKQRDYIERKLRTALHDETVEVRFLDTGLDVGAAMNAPWREQAAKDERAMYPFRCPRVTYYDYSIGGEGEIICGAPTRGVVSTNDRWSLVVCERGHEWEPCDCGAVSCTGWRIHKRVVKPMQTHTCPDVAGRDI